MSTERLTSFDIKWIPPQKEPLFPHQDSDEIVSHAKISYDVLSPCDHDKLFGSHLKAPTWASFTPPCVYEESSKKCFDKWLIPGLSLERALERYESHNPDPHLSAFFALYEDLSKMMKTILVQASRYKKG